MADPSTASGRYLGVGSILDLLKATVAERADNDADCNVLLKISTNRTSIVNASAALPKR